jgi:hypothetical protein
MKRILLSFFAFIFIFLNSYAQAPEKMTYQAIIRDAGNNVLASTTVGMKISILKGSTSGTVVYTETQTPSTNINGLVTIEIGDGSGFAINWSNDSYFIKTETDPSGGTNYTITGTMQLLSVPYALHAKTADAVTAISLDNLSDAKSNTLLTSYYIGHNSGINSDDAAVSNTAVGSFSGDGFGTGGKNTAIGDNTGVTDGTLTHTTTLGYNAKANASNQVVLGTITETVIIPNKIRVISQDWNEGQFPGGIVGELYVDSNNNALYYNDGTSWERIDKQGTYSVGDWALGGVVFYVDETGQHGLVCNLVDLADLPFSPTTSDISFAHGDGLYAGQMNTNFIVAQRIHTTNPLAFAAWDCSQYNSGITFNDAYGDWYLPSKHELEKMYENKTVINSTISNNVGMGLSDSTYWSSTENGLNGKAFAIDFNDGSSNTAGELRTNIYKVRAVRKF